MSREKLFEDLDRVNKYLRYLEYNQNRNFQVMMPDYLTPTMWEDETPCHINHTQGANAYFRRIRSVLLRAIKQGNISEDELPHNAPKYLEELVIT